MRQVLIYSGEDGWFVAECPSLPGCVSQGRTKDEAIANIKEAIELYIEGLKDEGQPVPEERFGALIRCADLIEGVHTGMSEAIKVSKKSSKSVTISSEPAGESGGSRH